MIRKFIKEDLEEILKIWLETNIKAHNFISEDYWKDNLDMVKSMLPCAEIFVYEPEGKIRAFIGIDNGYIAGIFVSFGEQSKGLGKLLLETAKENYSNLSLSVYEKNIRAVNFYLREEFIIQNKRVDENTDEIEYFMVWNK